MFDFCAPTHVTEEMCQTMRSSSHYANERKPRGIQTSTEKDGEVYMRCSSNCRIEMCAVTTRRIICIAALLLLMVPSSSSLKALLVTFGAAGHVTPMFELAKAMKDHQVTFITHRFAQSYVDIEGYASPSFRIVYTNDSSEAFADQKAGEQQLLSYIANQSLFDALGEVAPLLGGIILSLVNETAHVLVVERFDVIVASGMIFVAPQLCEKARTPLRNT